MPKSDSTRKPKLPPKVWVILDRRGYLMGLTANHSGYPKGYVHQYAPLQPPRRCVWESVGMNAYRRNCNNQVWPWRGDFEGGHCPGCGGKIRRKS